MKIEDVTGGKVKIGNTVYNMVEAKYNGVVVWPASASQYVIVPGTITLHFSAGNILYANGQNCVEYITANVQNTATGVVTQNVTLTPTLESGSAYYIGVGGSIWGPNLGTTETGLHSESVTVTYQNASATVTIQQEANIRTVTRTDYGTWTETSRTPSGNPYDYHVSIAADRYTLATSSDECPASGGSATLYFPSGTCYHIQDYNVTRTRTVTEYCTYTATESTVHTEPQPNQTNSYTDYAQVTDTPTITGSATGFTRNGMVVSIANRGTNNNDQASSAARSVTYTATNGSGANAVTATVTIHQEANVPEQSYQFILSVDIDVDGKIPAEPGIYDVSYVSRRATTKVYPSGASVDLGTSDITTSVSVTGTGSATPSVNSVTGAGQFTLSVDQNWDTENEKTITVSISTAGATPASDTITQEAAEVIVTPTAKVWPDLNSNNRPCLNFLMTQGNYPGGSVVLSGVQYWFVLENTGDGQPHAVSLGDITITSDGQKVTLTSLPMYGPGSTGEHWFSATSVSRIGLSNTTFPHDVFDVMDVMDV